MMKEGLLWFIIALTAGYCCAINITGNVVGYSGCSIHDQCSTSHVCIEGKCSDPCDELCGNNTSCIVRYHIPACACKEGHTGNPLLGCTPQDVPECGSNDDCATDRVCAKHHCVDPCEGVCGPNTKCQVTQHVAMCSCSPGYFGNPGLGCTASPQGTWPLPGKKKFYAVTSHEVDWQGAFMYCVKNNSRLASIDSVEEYEEIKELADLTGRNKRFWTSGSDSASEGQFIWASTGKNVSLPKYLWYEGEPNNTASNEHCIDLHKEHKLNDNTCDTLHNFFCEYYA